MMINFKCKLWNVLLFSLSQLLPSPHSILKNNPKSENIPRILIFFPLFCYSSIPLKCPELLDVLGPFSAFVQKFWIFQKFWTQWGLWFMVAPSGPFLSIAVTSQGSISFPIFVNGVPASFVRNSTVRWLQIPQSFILKMCLGIKLWRPKDACH